MLGVAAECVTKEQIDFALDAQMLTFCTNGDEYALVKKVWDLQEHNDSRFRIWGQTDTAGVSYIWLVTEFATLVTNKKMWRELIDLSRFLSGSVRNINKAPHCDHTYYHYGTPEQTEVFGPDHGKMERQVEMYWNVLTWKEREIIAQREEFAVRTQSLWDSYGVGVC
jgi:hypothetical protein